MVILSGPASPLNGTVSAMLRTGMSDPFDNLPTNTNDARLAIMAQIVRVLLKLTASLDALNYQPLPPEDNFMKGWGEPGGSIDL